VGPILFICTFKSNLAKTTCNSRFVCFRNVYGSSNLGLFIMKKGDGLQLKMVVRGCSLQQF